MPLPATLTKFLAPVLFLLTALAGCSGNPQAIAVDAPELSFSPPMALASGTGQWSAHDPALAADAPRGLTYLAYVMGIGGVNSTQHGGIGIGNVYIKRSSDDGKTFTNAVRVNAADGDAYPDYRVAPSIAVGPRGEVYVAWVNTTQSPKLMHGMRTLHVAVSKDSAETFSPATAIVDPGAPSGRSFFDLDVSQDGTLYAAWLDSPVTKDANGTLVSDKARPSTVRIARSTNGGQSFEPSVAVGTDPCPCCNVFVLAGEGDDVYVSWRGISKNPAGKSIREIMVASSNDAGQNFAAPVNVQRDGFEIEGCVHVGAPMAMDSAGRIHIAWYTGKEGASGIFHAVSTNRGMTFGAPNPIVVAGWVPPSRVDLAIDEDDNAWLAYEYPAELRNARDRNDPIWRYGNASALIGVTKVAPDGAVLPFSRPLNIVNGRVPSLAIGPDVVIVAWGSVSDEVWATSARLG